MVSDTTGVGGSWNLGSTTSQGCEDGTGRMEMAVDEADLPLWDWRAIAFPYSTGWAFK